MSRFDQRVREGLSDPEFAAGYWEADADIERLTVAPTRVVVLQSSATTADQSYSVSMQVKITSPSVQPAFGWNPDTQLLGDRAPA